jgi:hypothetical protein
LHHRGPKAAAESVGRKMNLKIELVNAEQVQGTFTLILYSGPWLQRIANVAFLDREDDRITFDPYAPDFDYKIFKGIPAKEAIARAEAFVSTHSSFHHSQLACIRDEYERIVGFEMRPMYLPTTYGTSDVLFIDYDLEDNKIIIHIRINPDVERML